MRDELTQSPALHYSEYLCLDKILSAQRLLSAEYGDEVHDEHLFIVTHQGILLITNVIFDYVLSLTSKFFLFYKTTQTLKTQQNIFIYLFVVIFVLYEFYLNNAISQIVYLINRSLPRF